MRGRKIIFCLFLIFLLVFSQQSIISANNKSNVPSINSSTNLKIPFQESPKNKIKISNSLQNNLSDAKNDSKMVDVIITLDHVPTNSDVSTFEKYGGIVLETWNTLINGFHGKIQQQFIKDYSANNGIVRIEKNEKITASLDYSVKQIGVRPTVWDTYGYKGNSNQAIAILDTGIDDSHPDLSGKIVAWKDFTSEGYTTPTDKGEHGTHCAGIVAGTGVSSGTSTKKYTMSGQFYLEDYFGDTTYVTPTKSGTLSLTLQWDDDYSDGYGQAFIWIDLNQNGVLDSGEYIIGYQTLTYSVSVNSGRYEVGVGAADYESSFEDFFCQINVPTQSLGDGHYLLTGVAPNCKLAGLKVLDDDGSGQYSDIIDALTWLATNAQTYNIVVASMSLGGPQSDIVDTV